MAKRRSDADRRARQSQRIGRSLRLLCLIQERHGRWDLKSLAEELGCSTKTVQRDLQALEEARIPFYFDKQACCYRLRPGFRLPILDEPPEAAPGGADASTQSAQEPPTSVELADLSQESAERLLCEAERLVETLSQLCRTLRQSGHRDDDDDRPRAK